ncbi:hypothetical protein Tco_0545978 [Tanacetum coccineum]
MEESYWIEAMQKEIHEFKRLEVCELVPRPDRAMIINLKWIFKVKLNEYGGVLKNKARLVAKGQLKLDADLNETLVDPTRYQGMVRSIMYLTTSRPNLVFAVYMCVRYQTKPTEKHLTTVKRVFWYLKGTINIGLWYLKDTDFNLTAFADADHADQVENEVVELYFVKIDYQLADIFTKALIRERFKFLINHLDMQSITPEELKRLVESDEE